MSELVPLNSQFLVYRDEAGNARLDVRFDGDTVWLTQTQLVELFDSSQANISEHISNVLAEGELLEEATVREFRTVQTEGAREIDRARSHYNLDMIISVGYRVRSKSATAFRMWATQRLREFIVKGFVLDDERLKGHSTLRVHRELEPTQRGGGSSGHRRAAVLIGQAGQLAHGSSRRIEISRCDGYLGGSGE